MKISIFFNFVGIIIYLSLLSCISAPVSDNSTSLDKLVDEIADCMNQDKQITIAVTDFPDIDGNKRKYSIYLSDELITNLFKTGKFRVIERKKLDEILKEQELTISDLFNSSKVVNIGKLAGADAIVVGTLTEMEGEIKINTRIIDVETAEILSVASTSVFIDNSIQPLWKEIISETKKQDDTIIKDKNLEKIIRKQINKPEGLLTVDDLKRVIELNAPDSSIFSLEGIEHCINLTKLELTNYDWIDKNTYNNNIIRNIKPITNLKYLEFISLSGCKIDNDPKSLKDIFKDLNRIYFLNLSANNILSFDFLPKGHQLAALFLDGNPNLKGLEYVFNFPNLEYFGIGGMNLTGDDIDIISQLTNLKRINLFHCNLKNLSFLKNHINLVELLINNNHFEDISILLEIHKKGAFPNGSKLSIIDCNLDLQAGSSNRKVIDTLMENGVIVEYEEGNKL